MLHVPRVQGTILVPAYTPASLSGPVTASGKFLWQNGEPFYIRGVTYGTFAPDANGDQFPPPAQVAEDMRAIAANGFNTVRTYTVPPAWMFDIAAECGLRLLVGLTWEQHVAFLNDRDGANDIRRRVQAQAMACRGQSSLLGFTVGNEIPATIVRWHGRKQVENFLHDLYAIAKSAEPSALATYVNFPTTAYLELPFLDFAAFNVYLEEEKKLSAYLKRLQNIAGDLPLVMAEIGLDSRRNGETAQAESLAWQIRTAFREGCAGAFAYAWTDEWYRGGSMIEDWDFGLTTRARVPKTALHAVRTEMAKAPFCDPLQWPSVSVVVCSYNGSKTIRDTLDHLAQLDYPDYEVIVVNDGSTDDTPKIAAEYDVRLISTHNQGLSKARNEGLEAARGEIVVYTDDDAYPTPQWLKYLAQAFMRGDHACIGGPNLVPPEDGETGQCVADSPGGPLHVLVTDEIAEHVPGCNMAFRREKLAAIGGFDPLYRAAGDDVDVCWRLQDRGWTIGFCAPAMVWHHRRATVKRYWRQQVGYGKAEALLERKWPERFSALGHMSWAGQIYGRGLARTFLAPRPRVYQGVWGLAPYQGLYQAPQNHLLSLALTPEWLIPAIAMFAIGVLGIFLPPLEWALLPSGAMFGVSFAQALRGAKDSRYLLRARGLTGRDRARVFATIFLMHLMQPAARLWGRIKHGLTPWRRGTVRHPLRRVSIAKIWSETWHAPEDWLGRLESAIKRQGGIVTRGEDYESWDLRVRGGFFANATLNMAVEDHERGRQYLRFRKTAVWTRAVPALAVPAAFVTAIGLVTGTLPGFLLGSLFLAGVAWKTLADWQHAAGHINSALMLLTAESELTADKKNLLHLVGDLIPDERRAAPDAARG